MEKVDSGQEFAARPLVLLEMASDWREVCVEPTAGYLFKRVSPTKLPGGHCILM